MGAVEGKAEVEGELSLQRAESIQGKARLCEVRNLRM